MARGRYFHTQHPLLWLLLALVAAQDEGVQVQVAALGFGASCGGLHGLHVVRGEKCGRDFLGLVWFRHREPPALDLHSQLQALRLGDAWGSLRREVSRDQRRGREWG